MEVSLVPLLTLTLYAKMLDRTMLCLVLFESSLLFNS